MTADVATRERLDLTIPVAPRINVQLHTHRPMTGEEWHQMWLVLEAMKPGIVYTAGPAAAPADT